MVNKRLKSWLKKEETIVFFSSYSTFIIGFVTLIVSIVNVFFVCQQTKINKTLSQLQISQNQPFFVIYTELMQDSTDGKYGTEHLFVENHGFSNITTSVNENVLFEFTRCQRNRIDTILISVDDYFWLSFSSSSDKFRIYHSLGPSNNRTFYDLYLKTLYDRNEDETTYFIEKYILVQIEYSDLLNTNYTKYYINGIMVNEEKYKKTLSKVQNRHYNLNNLDYESIKKLFDKKQYAIILESNPKLVNYEAVQKWDGKMPQYMLGNSVPFIDLK